MKIVYLSSTASGMHSSSIYYDLLQEFISNGHEVTVVYARESRQKLPTEYYKKNGINYLGVKTFNITKNKNMIEKGISTLTIDHKYKNAIKKYLKDQEFDLLLYSTPPISLIKTVEFLQSSSRVKSILMLKDIFPQNAVDLNLFNEKSIIYKFFRRQELKLYSLFDKIGTMSDANTKYLLSHTQLDTRKVFKLPNSIKVVPKVTTLSREHFGIPKDKVVLLYGGNLGRPQAIPFLLDCVRSIRDNDEVIFVVAGTGSEAYLVEDFVENEKQNNFVYLGSLEVDEYENLTNVSDIGLIFLDDNFTIPNYPQRVLSYMNAKIPIISCTDSNTDIGTESEENGYGIAIRSNDVDAWNSAVRKLASSKNLRTAMGKKGYEYLSTEFSVEKAYQTIKNQFDTIN